jgi:hypothetical protein
MKHKKQEVDNITLADAEVIVNYYGNSGGDTDTKREARRLLREKHLSVLDALVLVEAKCSSRPKTKCF